MLSLACRGPYRVTISQFQATVLCGLQVADYSGERLGLWAVQIERRIGFPEPGFKTKFNVIRTLSFKIGITMCHINSLHIRSYILSWRQSEFLYYFAIPCKYIWKHRLYHFLGIQFIKPDSRKERKSKHISFHRGNEELVRCTPFKWGPKGFTGKVHQLFRVIIPILFKLFQNSLKEKEKSFKFFLWSSYHTIKSMKTRIYTKETYRPILLTFIQKSQVK